MPRLTEMELPLALRRVAGRLGIIRDVLNSPIRLCDTDLADLAFDTAWEVGEMAEIAEKEAKHRPNKGLKADLVAFPGGKGDAS